MTRETVFEPARTIRERIDAGHVSPVDVVSSHLARIESREPTINAFVERYEEEARQRAESTRDGSVAGPAGPLRGVPIAVKDNIPVEGERLTLGAIPFAENVAEKTDPAVAAVRDAGGVLVGKTNLPELATKPVTDNALFGPTRNPYDPERIAGGSSGGSAAAVADGMVALALGTDSGGSARIPASACGIFGMKPSFGRVPTVTRPNGFAHHTPMQSVCPMARTVADAALLLNVMDQDHEGDPFVLPPAEVEYVAATRRSVAEFDIAYSPDLGLFPVSDEIRAVTDAAADRFERTGADVSRIDLCFENTRGEILDAYFTSGRLGLADMYDVYKNEHGVDLLAEHRDDLESHNVEAIEEALELGALEYKRTEHVRTAVFDTIQDVFAEHDILLTPMLSVVPFEHGKPGPETVAGESIDPLAGWTLGWPFNMTGHPAASVPCGHSSDGLPVGMQVVGSRFADEDVLAVCAAYERADPWHRYPPDAY